MGVLAADLVSQAQSIFVDTGLVSSNEWYVYLNQALKEIVIKNPELAHTDATMATVPGQSVYSFPSSASVLGINWVGYNDPGKETASTNVDWVSKKLTRIDQYDQQAMYYDSTSTGTPQFYRMTDSNEICVSPTPDTTGSFCFDWNQYPAAVASDSTIVGELEPFCHYAVDYMCFRAFLKDQASASIAGVYRNEWTGHLKDVSQTMTDRRRSDRFQCVKDVYARPIMGRPF